MKPYVICLFLCLFCVATVVATAKGQHLPPAPPSVTSQEPFALRMEKQEPKNPRWPWELAKLYHSQIGKIAAQRISSADMANLYSHMPFPRSTPSAPTNPELPAKKAVQQLQRFLALVPSSNENWLLAHQLLAEDAVTAKEPSLARKEALFLLAYARKAPHDSEEAYYVGNEVLGRLALQQNNIPLANHYLLQAGRTAGSPVLRGFGPNMRLANNLLAKGQKATVLSFLQECSRFWPDASYYMKMIRQQGKIESFYLLQLIRY